MTSIEAIGRGWLDRSDISATTKGMDWIVLLTAAHDHTENGMKQGMDWKNVKRQNENGIKMGWIGKRSERRLRWGAAAHAFV